MNQKILIVENDPNVRDRLVEAFSANGFQSLAAPDEPGAIFDFGLLQPDLVILGIPQAGEDRWQTLRRIREVSSVPVIMLTVPDDREGNIESLERGADSFVTKPFDMRELRARVRALLRRVQHAAQATGNPSR